MLTDTKTLIARFERQAHRMGELRERCQGKGWPDAESAEFTALRDERLPAMRAALETIESAACAPLLERIAELEAELAQRVPDGWQMVPAVPTHMMELRGSISWENSGQESPDVVEIYQVMLAAAPAAPEQQEPKSPCACRPGMMCNRSATCADEIRRDAAQAPNAQQAEPEQQEPSCPKCGNNRQVWTNQISGEKVCHRVGCHEVVPLTHDQIENGAEIGEFDNLCRWQIFEAGVRFAEAAHGIVAPAEKGG